MQGGGGTLSALSDIDFSSGLQNGMVLVYNTSNSRWEATLELTPGSAQNLDINGGNFVLMASIIRVKRSTGTGAPSSLNYGELGLTIGVGTTAIKVVEYLLVIMLRMHK